MRWFGMINGNDEQTYEAKPTSSLLGDVLGIGGLVKAMSDPAMMQGAYQMMAALTAAGMTLPRLEAKLDLLLKDKGYDVETLFPTAPGVYPDFQAGHGAWFPDSGGHQPQSARLPAGMAGARPGGDPAAGGAIDDGTRPGADVGGRPDDTD
jgi:hypothetical protein